MSLWKKNLSQFGTEEVGFSYKLLSPKLVDCMEVEEFIFMRKWLELVSSMITSAKLNFSKFSEKG
ncbi:hypothetical protein MTR_8g066550 [Medicago truncatula]|uniref:Uncharacterized protein n=1 Tax=Medicago truncatula TaxID=3880 RepID=G7LGZ8_MEDTR|nr:hypothetical protein MTR_8g066550 [Medicago truncatula]